MTNLFLALKAEHKQRTGHDIFAEPTHARPFCDVCTHLAAEWRRAELADNLESRESGKSGGDD